MHRYDRTRTARGGVKQFYMHVSIVAKEDPVTIGEKNMILKMELQKTKALRCMVVRNGLMDLDFFTEGLNKSVSSIQFTVAEDFDEAQSLISAGKEFDTIVIDLSDAKFKFNEISLQINILSQQASTVVLASERHYRRISEALPSGEAGCLIQKTATPGELRKAILCAEKISRLNHAVSASELRFKKLFNSYPAMIFICDPDTGKFLDVNESAVSQLGYSRKEFLAMQLKDLSTSLREKGSLFGHRVFGGENAESLTQIEKFSTKNGEILDLQIVFMPFKAGGKDVDMLLATNVSSKIKQGRIIEIQNQRFDNIAWTQSHIVRAPVARLMALINIFRNGMIDDSERRAILDHIYESAEEIDELVRGIALASNNAKKN